MSKSKKKSNKKSIKKLSKTAVSKAKKDTFADRFKAVVELAAKDAGKETYLVTIAEFLDKAVDVNEWEVRKRGGFNALRKLYFQEEKAESFIEGNKLISSFRNKIERQYGKEEFIASEFTATVESIFEKYPVRYHKPVNLKKSSSKKCSRTIVAHLSDTHYGANIDQKEMGGLNSFNWEVAARRTALFAEQIAQYKPQYREDTELVLCINGDIIAGVIHDQEWFVDLLAVQFSGTLNILVQMVGYLAQNFKSVRVECATGNHGRGMHKGNKGRSMTHKWDSYESMVYVALREATRAYKNVSVNTPITPYNIFDVQGHKFFLTHGDTVFNLGNPGKAVNVGGINEQINKLNASQLSEGQSFSGVICGHVHTPLTMFTDSGCALIVNGCLSGLDPFAQAIGIFSSNPTQQLFEVTDPYAVGDIRFIQLSSADARKELDLIIAPFKGALG